MVDSIIQGGSGYRILSPSDVEPILENVQSGVLVIMPIALVLFFIVWSIDVIPFLIKNHEEIYLRISQLFNTLKAFIYKKKKERKEVKAK